MAECIHRELCVNECPCDYFVGIQETDYTVLVPDYKGVAIVTAHCANCGQPVQYMRERPYNFCPYCGRRVMYKEET